MAAADSMNTLVGLTNMIGAIQGTSKNQSSTQTTQGNISQAGVDRVLQQILAGKGGVKDIAGAARGAGLYNSSTEAQLQNDLAARAAGEVAARQAGTTTTTDTTVDQPGLGIGSLIKPMIGMGLIRPLLDQVMGMGTAGSTGTTAAASAPLTTAGQVTAPNPIAAGTATGDLSNMAQASMVNTASGINNVISGLTASGSGAAVQGTGALGGSLASDLGMTAADAASAASTAVNTGSAAAGGAAGGLSGIPLIGNVLSGLLGGSNGDPFGSPFGLATSMAGGAAAMGPLGLIAAPVAATFGMMLSDLGISIICSALQHHGLLDEKEYAKGQEYIKRISKKTLRGYYHFGIPAAKAIYKEKGQGKVTRLVLPWARSRTSLIAAKGKWVKYLRYPLGTLTILVGQPICYGVGTLLILRDRLEELRDGIRI